MAAILIVDDEEKMGILLAGALEDAGLATEAFTDPVAAVERLKNRRFDMVLTDLKMEPIDGMTILATVCSMRLK